MKSVFILALIIISITAVSGFAQKQEGTAGQGGAAVQNGSQMMESKTGPGMTGSAGYAGMIDPRTTGAMIGYVMKPNMIRTFENDPAVYQYFLDQTEGLRKQLLNKMFDYYEAMRKPNSKAKTLQKIEKEIVDLRWKIYDKGTKQK